jgi:hypothetical protein
LNLEEFLSSASWLLASEQRVIPVVYVVIVDVFGRGTSGGAGSRCRARQLLVDTDIGFLRWNCLVQAVEELGVWACLGGVGYCGRVAPGL